jgi:hypothetical protein
MKLRSFIPILLAPVAVLTLAPSAHAQASAAWSACFSTDARQCSVAGRHYMNGTGGAQAMPEWAKSAWDHGCQANDGESCKELGLLHERGTLVAADPRAAAAFFNRGCQLGSMAACHEQARGFRLGVGVAVNAAEANRLDEWACNYGNSAACVQMSEVHALGVGVPPNPTEMQRFLARACELGDRPACEGRREGTVTPPSALGPSPGGGGIVPPPPTTPGTSGPPTAPPSGAPYGGGIPQPPPTYGGTPPQPHPGRPGHPGAPPAEALPPHMARAIDATIAQAMPRLSQCQERASRRHPVRGSVVVMWTIDPNGRTRDVIVQPTSTIQDRWMQRCVNGVVRRMRFDPRSAPAVPITRAFAFN